MEARVSGEAETITGVGQGIQVRRGDGEDTMKRNLGRARPQMLVYTRDGGQGSLAGDNLTSVGGAFRHSFLIRKPCCTFLNSDGQALSRVSGTGIVV